MKKVLMMAAIAATLVSCSKSDSNNTNVDKSITDSILVNASATTSQFTLYSFTDTAEIDNSDSATSKWDFALRSTIFLVNSMSSGPGNASAQLFDANYADLSSFPTTGYAKDTATTNRAIKDQTWYDYNPATRTFSPKTGKTFLFKTANTQKNVKMELLMVEPRNLVAGRPTKYLYKFRYTLQP